MVILSVTNHLPGSTCPQPVLDAARGNRKGHLVANWGMDANSKAFVSLLSQCVALESLELSSSALRLPSMKHEAPKARSMCSRNEDFKNWRLLEISWRPSASLGLFWSKHHACKTCKIGLNFASFWEPKKWLHHDPKKSVCFKEVTVTAKYLGNCLGTTS